MAEFECVFHSDKLRFQKIERSIQKARIIPRPYVYRLGNAVCSCKKKKVSIDFLESSEGLISLNRIHDTVQELIDSNPDILATLKAYLSHTGNLCGIRRENYSLFMLMYIIHMSHVNKDYSLLDNCSPRKKEARQARAGKVQYDYEKLIRKKRKKLKNKRKMQLSIFPGNLKILRLSPGFKDLIQQFKADIVLGFDTEANEKTFNSGTSKSVIVCNYRDSCEHKLERFLSAIRHLAARIQGSQDRMLKARKEQKRARREYCLAIHHARDEDAFGSIVSAYEVKENLSIDFEKQSKGKKLDRRTLVPSPLEGGHCLHCLKPWKKNPKRSTSSDEDDEDLERHGDEIFSNQNGEQCRHHPGFINSKHEWTCCNTSVEEDKPSYQEHLSTGCTVLLGHRWRCHKKPDRKLMGCTNRTGADALKLYHLYNKTFNTGESHSKNLNSRQNENTNSKQNRPLPYKNYKGCKCLKCGTILKTVRACKAHIYKEHLPLSAAPYHCDICLYRCDNIIHFEQHVYDRTHDYYDFSGSTSHMQKSRNPKYLTVTIDYY